MRNNPETQRFCVVAKDGHGLIVAHSGVVIGSEIAAMSSWTDDINVPRPPDGMSIWEGTMRWDSSEDPDLHCEGAYRPLTPSERMLYAKTGEPWR